MSKLNTREAADALGIAESTLKVWSEKFLGRLPHYNGRKPRRFTRQDIEKFRALYENRAPSPPPPAQETSLSTLLGLDEQNVDEPSGWPAREPGTWRSFGSPAKPAAREAVLLLSDVHYGAQFPGNEVWRPYNSEIASRRLSEVVERARAIIRQHALTSLHIAMLGDMIDGTHLREQHARETDQHTVQQILGLQDILAEHLTDMLAEGLSLSVSGVGGNHARLQRRWGAGDPGENLDLLLYQSLMRHLGMTQIRWNLPDEGWFVMAEIVGRNWLFVHGEEVRGVSPIRSAGVQVEKYQQHLRARGLKPIEMACLGHHHAPEYKDFGHTEIWINGAIQGASEFTAKTLNKTHRPSQTLLIVSEAGVDATYIIKPEA